METSYRLMLRHRTPIIGSRLNLCPQCGRPLSFSDRAGYYCRGCQAAKKEAIRKYIQIMKEGR